MNRNKVHESTIMLALASSSLPATNEASIQKLEEEIANDLELEVMSHNERDNALYLLQDMGAIAQPHQHWYRITLLGYQLFPEETGGECE